jgi:hypothetical protein
MKKTDIEALILTSVGSHPDDLVIHVAGVLSVTPRMVLRHVSRLVAEGRLSTTGRTKGRRYMAGAPVSKISSLPLKLGVVPQVAVELLSKLFAFPVSPALHEDEVWQGYLAPELSDLPDNSTA